MADSKLTALTANTTPASADILYIVDDPGGSPLSQKITWGNLLGANLTAIYGLTSAANKLPYFTGSGTAGVADFSAFGRTLVDDADAAAGRTTLAAAGTGVANTFAAAQFIDGAADAIQLRVQGHSTQTSKTLTVENSSATVVTSISNAGLIDTADIQFSADTGTRIYRGTASRVDFAGSINTTSYVYVGANQTLARSGSVLQLAAGFSSITTVCTFAATVNDATTNAITNILTAGHNTSGTPANGLGAGLLFNLETSTTVDTTAGQVAVDWDDVTHATRSSKVLIKAANSSGLADGIQVDDDATAGNTRLLVYDVDNATVERVSVGAADSGGTGYKVLRIPN